MPFLTVCRSDLHFKMSKPKDPAFPTVRSPVYASRGMVASTQPLASQAGLRILQQGGNAADAAVAIAASLNVTEPCSTGTPPSPHTLLKHPRNRRRRLCFILQFPNKDSGVSSGLRPVSRDSLLGLYPCTWLHRDLFTFRSWVSCLKSSK